VAVSGSLGALRRPSERLSATVAVYGAVGVGEAASEPISATIGAAPRVSVKSVVQRAPGAQAGLVMVVRPVLGSRFFGAMDELARLQQVG